MTGEYVDQQQEGETRPIKFLKLQQHQSPSQYHLYTQNPYHISRPDSQTSEEDNSRSSGGPTQTPNSTAVDGGTIEAAKRARGRPKGSKNRPKEPVYITRDAEPAMSPYILEVPSGIDVVRAITQFCRRKNIALCLLTASGTVANVTLRQQSTSPGANEATAVIFKGYYEILSLSATLIPHPSESLPAMPKGFTVALAGPHGQIVGGILVDGLMAVGTVYVIAASFNNPSHHRLPVEDESSGAMPMHNLQLPPNGIWTPIATTSQPPPY